jgi:hypothetical protein
MKPILTSLAALSLAAPALAQTTREMAAHVHGVSKAEIAVEHGTVKIDLLSPGMDIVGFEHAADSAGDKDAVEAAIRTLLVPENIVTLPDAAGCRLTEVLAHLHGGAHDHDDANGHVEGDHDHADGDDHEDHADEGHDHDHEDDHAGEGRHSEFHVSYAFACEDEDALTAIGFPFFDQFGSAEEIEAQFVTESGAGQAELTRDSRQLTLE